MSSPALLRPAAQDGFSRPAWGLLVVVLALSVTTVPARAGDELFVGVARLDATRLVDLVESRNAGLEAARAAAEAAAFRVKPAGSLEDPMVSYMLAPRTIGSDLGGRHGVEVSQALPWPGTLGARKAQARAEADSAEDDAQARVLDVIAATKSAFAEWGFVHAALSVNHQHQGHLRALKVAAERSYAADAARQQDALKAALELAHMENEALMLESQRRAVRARINGLLARDADAALPPPASFKAFSALPPLDRLEMTALARHPELKSREAAIAASDAGITVARKAFYPDVKLSAGYNEMWDQPEMRPSVGVSLSVPLQWGRRQAALDGARATRRQAEWMLIDQTVLLRAKLAEAYAAADQAGRSVALYRDRLLPLADAAYSASLADYRNGRGDFDSVIAAARARLDQQLGLERALADQFRARATLEKAAGGPLGETSEARP